MIAVLGATKSCPVKCEQQRPGAAKTRSHTLNIVAVSWRRDWPRGFGAFNSSHHYWIFISFLVGSNYRSYLSTSATVWIPVHTRERVTQNLSDMLLSTFVISAAQLRYVTKIALLQPFLCVKRRPIRYDFLKLSAIGESLLTSLFTFFLISIRLNS